SPAKTVVAFRARQRERRKTPVQPSQVSRRKARPRRKPRCRYTTATYDHAIYRACDRAFPPPAPLAQGEKESKKKWMERLAAEQKEELKRWRSEHRWHANRLRHSRATEIRKLGGLDAARAVLGHSSASITEIYAELDTTIAERIMREIG